jgi:hypothetical protein
MMQKFRWWLATVFAEWAYLLTRHETGDEPAWLIEFACADVRRRAKKSKRHGPPGK